MERKTIIQWSITGAAVLFFLVVLIYTIDYIAFRDDRIKNNLATSFCECTLMEAVQNGDYELLEEGFQYATGLNPCFAEEFEPYKKGLSDAQREFFLQDLEKRIFKRCPHSAEKIFQ
ncbi:hypothetical protein [Saprospira grandis]|uniref:Uncharacterized protein n=1 Tax=Saprospira grandis (strain Lewin) TaxID=984262 RepID=H6L146_SAPGL|nr:hypothetical protein [Saprospira grandis]AFC26082.1 hypothetical protein SGRA_3355 [Saprospira grandis str. Lewin]